ncbi:MAG: hypothetical protein RIB45_06845 [Marivibrio sp.]|uniref:hypothetical protein n=1 Tax=Marivibrio sp. TaxID=2039719 RepID=UPI0032EF461F
MSGLEKWLRQPDERDIVPVRGVVMRLAADEIRRLEAENARLKEQAAAAEGAAEPPAEITFQDGSVTRRLVRAGEGYALPEGAETLDDLLSEQAADAAAASPDRLAPDGAAPSEETDAEDVAPSEEAAPDAADAPDAAEAPSEGDEAAHAEVGGGEAEDDEDFELPPEWQ